MTIVTQAFTTFDALMAFVDAWKPYAHCGDAPANAARECAWSPVVVRTCETGRQATVRIWLRD